MNIAKRVYELAAKVASEISTAFKLIVDKYNEGQAYIIDIEEFNILISYQYLKNLPPKAIEWRLDFQEVMEEVSLLHETKVRVDSIVMGNAFSVYYSIDEGETWVLFSAAIIINAGTSRWRVPNFGAFGRGAIKIKGVVL